jgi:zinc transporter ZupT
VHLQAAHLLQVKFSGRQVLFFTAFGAGILISAAIFGMVIEAERTLGIIMTLGAFLAGSIILTIADVSAEKKGGGAGILLVIGLDSIPEALAIGASIASGPGFVIALLIGIQNIPEGIASFREMTSDTTTAFVNLSVSSSMFVVATTTLDSPARALRLMLGSSK